MELLRVSRDLGEVAATVHVAAGETYVLRLGSYYCDADGCGIGSRGSFEIAWRPSDPPALLRYVGRVVGEATPRGSWFIELATLGDQAFNGDGSELYVASDAGLVVFERDAETGDLTMLETVAPGLVDSYTDLIWDETGSALLAVSCSAWRKFSPAEGGGVKHVANVAGAPCPLGDVLVAGDLVHHVMAPWMIETLRFDEDRESLSAVGVNTIPDIAHAAITADGGNVYAITNDRGEYGLIAMERDGETGSLRITAIVEEGSPTGGAGEGLVEGLVDVAALTVHGSHLFVSAGARAATTLVFDLADRANPVFLGNWSLNQRNFGACDHRAARHDVAALDIACGFGEWFVVQAGADGSVFASDRMRSEFTDSFGNVLPQSGDVASFVASPDGRHVYMAGSFFYLEIDPQAGFIFGHRNQMLVFERVYGD